MLQRQLTDFNTWNCRLLPTNFHKNVVQGTENCFRVITQNAKTSNIFPPLPTVLMVVPLPSNINPLMNYCRQFHPKEKKRFCA